ncbi:hypothetical protein P7K49_036690 [Saguinus oedipus]|uniref:Uncharacterized protein n=1 Tax=Saguinus oedipus TaxID=9490 RepID=A0ABQ9TLI7_SAGOE|nr:hypothetical protein P7K49_036690 [Saguinus oedipus]
MAGVLNTRKEFPGQMEQTRHDEVKVSTEMQRQNRICKNKDLRRERHEQSPGSRESVAGDLVESPSLWDEFLLHKMSTCTPQLDSTVKMGRQVYNKAWKILKVKGELRAAKEMKDEAGERDREVSSLNSKLLSLQLDIKKLHDVCKRQRKTLQDN